MRQQQAVQVCPEIRDLFVYVHLEIRDLFVRLHSEICEQSPAPVNAGNSSGQRGKCTTDSDGDSFDNYKDSELERLVS